MTGAALLSSLLLLAGAPAEVERDFEAAHERALAGDHEQAVALYRAVLERGYDDADVHYNLGHVLEDMGRPIEAIVAYERALARAPGDADAKHNLERLRAREVKGAPDPDPEAAGLDAALGPWIRGAPVGIVGWLAALALLAACVLRALRRAPPASAALFALAGLGLLFVAASAAIRSEARAVVVEAAPLREGPDPRFDARGRAAPGERVRILDRQGALREVQRVDGTTGWIEAAALARLDAPGGRSGAHDRRARGR
jgi:tetratricopeptide (TPR) repeat protein